MFYGAYSVGKSFLASQLVANVLKDGGTAVWVDTEQSFDPIWNRKNGVDTSKIIVLQPANGEEAFDVTRSALQEGVDIVVIDSFAGLVPETVQEEAFGYNPMAWQARFINSSLPKLLPHLKHGSALVGINQLRSNVGRVTYNNMPGGIGQQFYSHLQLEIRRVGWIEEDKKKIGFEMEIRLKKTKQGGDNWDSVILPYKVGGGIDQVEVTINEALEKGLIKQSGTCYTYNDERVQGKNRVRQYFIANPDKYEQLTKEVSSDLLS